MDKIYSKECIWPKKWKAILQVSQKVSLFNINSDKNPNRSLENFKIPETGVDVPILSRLFDL